MTPRQLLEFGKRLTAERERQKLSRIDLAEQAGISRTTLRNLERGGQDPEQATLDALAEALKTSVLALTGAPLIEPDDPKLHDLGDEDLEIAQAFHHAPLRVKHRALGVLQERGRREILSATVADWARRLLALDPDQRQLLALLITDMERRVEVSQVSIDAPPSAPILRESLADRKRDELWDLAQRLGLESLSNLHALAIAMARKERQLAAAEKSEQAKLLRAKTDAATRKKSSNKPSSGS